MSVSIKLITSVMILAAVAGCSKKGPSYIHDQTGPASAARESTRADAKPGVIVIKAVGDINPALNEFRDLLGTLNTSPRAVGGRREVNWDAVPAAFTNNNLFPGDFFGSADPALPDGRKRGIISFTPGNRFRISDTDFVDVNPLYSKQFNAFSPKKTLIADGNTITDNVFKVPGTNTNATVQAFGVVFSGVNDASSTSLDFYAGDELLGSFKVPNNGNNNPGGFSFLGVYFPNEKVTRVRIHSGSAPLSPTQNDLTDGGGQDLVIMDDFIYSEPAN